MGYLKLLAVVAVLFMLQSYYLMSSSHVEKFIFDNNALAMQDPVKACDNYTDDVQASIYYDMPTGHWEVEGGKDELCGYIRQGQAAMVVTQGSMSAMLENIKVTTNFPWQTATAEYDELSTASMGQAGSFNSKSHDSIAIKRTLTGLKITKITSTGGIEH